MYNSYFRRQLCFLAGPHCYFTLPPPFGTIGHNSYQGIMHTMQEMGGIITN